MNIYHLFLISMFLMLIKSTDQWFFSQKSEEAIQKTSSEELNPKTEYTEKNENDQFNEKFDSQEYEPIELPNFKKDTSNDNDGSDTLSKKSLFEKYQESDGTKKSNEKNTRDTSNENNRSNGSNEKNVSDIPNAKNTSDTSNDKNRSEKSKEENEFDISSNVKGSQKTNNKNRTNNSFSHSRNYDTIDTIHEARPSEYPYHVAFVWKPSGKLLCQGALIKPGWVVSSATCLQRYEKSVRNVGVLIGTTSLNDSSAVSRNIETMFHYERFNPKTNMDDFTLVQLEEKVYAEDAASPISVYNVYHPGKKCQFSTFVGNTLYGESIDYVDEHKDCDIPKHPFRAVTYFCASYNGSLIETESLVVHGSPLVCGDVVYGIKTIKTWFVSIDGLCEWMDSVVTLSTTEADPNDH